MTSATFSKAAKEWKVLLTFLAERFERCCLMINSNLVFSQWEQIFKDKMTAMASIDRLVHHAIILDVDGGSFQTKKKPVGAGPARED